ncbi:MAG TPA: sigma 54-interacting transcriptional regulator [Candidatus Angelobacter sp.]|nr:sigma 54-interacting transcriptional regulator [Candidatus Angelobacter sp.]
MNSQATPSYNHDELSSGLAILLRGILYPRQMSTTISSSLQLAASGLHADRAGLFLLRHEPASIHLEALYTQGLTEPQIHAVERGKDAEDTKLSQVWKVIQDHTPGPSFVTPREQQFQVQQRTGINRNFMCFPVRDPILDVLVAVLHFEGHAGFDENAEKWAENYTLALSQIIHLGFPCELREQVPAISETAVNLPEHAPELVGDSLCTQALRRELHDIYVPAASAPDPDPILILGEKGTGKDLVARYIYAYSARRNRPYIAVNCAEITDELATARFFGHKRGSFTGSMADEPGLFRAADHGVLFLDEIGDLSARAQGTLLRVLENRTVVPLGETKELRINVQVILGTNRDPERAVTEGSIRADLLDRFRTQEIRLAPLRDRPWDIPALVRHFLAHHENRTKKKILGMHPDILKLMVGYSWPGNVRELARVCSLLITHAKPGAPIDDALFSRLLPHIAREGWNPKAGALLVGDVPMRHALEMFGRELILARLRQHNWNIRSARESLGLPKTTFHRYTRTLGIAGSIHGGDPN